MTAHDRQIFCYPDPDAVAQAAADLMLPILLAAGERPISLALSGGSTPQRLYRLLAEEPYRSQIPWASVHVFLADERHVPHDHGDSNIKMIRETLLDHVLIPTANIHPMPTNGTAEQDAIRYQAELKAFFGSNPAQFDLVILGMGPDGHIASLFPERDLSSNDWTEPVFNSPKPPSTRLTLTLQQFNRSRNVLFLVTGTDKAEAFGAICKQAERSKLPAAMIRTTEGQVVWIIDYAAAAASTASEFKG